MIKLAVLGEDVLPLIDEVPQADIFGNPTTYGIPYERVAERSDGYRGNPADPALGTKPEVTGLESAVQQAVGLANAGQKQIFDTQMIATLAKYTDPASKIVEYVPDFVKTMDELGRLLFLMHWETGKFKDLYGLDDLPELVELLKNVFKNLGDLVVFLKRKIPDISINMNENTPEENPAR